MEKLRIQLENCYGIGRLDHEFDFSRSNAFSVYAPNGFMKTSLLQTLLDLSKGAAPRDRHYPDRETTAQLIDENGHSVPEDWIYAVPPLADSFSVAPSSLLLVNAAAKTRYEVAARDIEEKKTQLLKRMKSQSGLRGRTRTPEAEICECFGEDELLPLLESLEESVASEPDERVAALAYDRLFSDDAIQLYRSGELVPQLEEYIRTFNDLVEQSPILNRSFNHYHASTVQRSLADNGFFTAQHAVRLNDGANGQLIDTAEDLQSALEQERARVLGNEELVGRFNEIEGKLGKQGLRDLRDYLADNQDVILRLADFRGLQREMWLAFLNAESSAYSDLLQSFRQGRTEMLAAVEQAEHERTDWIEVVDQFNRRFKVPFEVSVENVADVVLREETPQLAFHFRDCEGEEPVRVDEKALVKSLSLGERRALYLLNILFEIRVRSAADHETVLFLDDVADSFDYRNKYAIIQYLSDIGRHDLFKVVALTHNFDFHRTLCSRLGIRHPDHRLYAVRTGRTIELQSDPYYKPTPFHHWRDELNTPQKIVASVPFVRNLAEYCGCSDAFQCLTSLLHIKPDTEHLTIADLEQIYHSVLKDEPAIQYENRDMPVVQIIRDTATGLAREASEAASLEDKVVLSIATRLAAEQYMIAQINDPELVLGIVRNQTQRLASEYRQRFGASANLELVDRVCLMTPESIHLNAFMYEPILDMSANELKALYTEVTTRMA